MAQPPGQYPEKPDKTDVAEEAAQAAIELIPWVGPALSRIVGYHWVTDLERRQSNWHNDVNAVLVSHAERIEGVEERLKSEEFLTLYIKASREAAVTHEAETREALKYAVLNTALEREEEDWSFIFIDLAARLRPAHLQLIAYYHDPWSMLSKTEIQVIQDSQHAAMPTVYAQYAFRDWNPDFFSQIHSDLISEHLLDTIKLKTLKLDRNTSDKGERFLAFINEPSSNDLSST